MNLLDCLMPRSIAVPDMRTYRKSAAQRKAHRDWYWRNVERERAKQRERDRRKHGG
jgi:hypothetical protein